MARYRNERTGIGFYVLFATGFIALTHTGLLAWFGTVLDNLVGYAGATVNTMFSIQFMVTIALSGGLVSLLCGAYNVIIINRERAAQLKRDLHPRPLHVGFGTNRLLTDDEFAKVITRLSTPAEEEPERCPAPLPRPLTDGAWDTWTTGLNSIGVPQYRNGFPALDRPFTMRADCQAGHVGDHHVGQHWTTPDGVTRVIRNCRYVCHSMWSEIV